MIATELIWWKDEYWFWNNKKGWKSYRENQHYFMTTPEELQDEPLDRSDLDLERLTLKGIRTNNMAQ